VNERLCDSGQIFRGFTFLTARVARFLMLQYTKTGKIYQITIKYSKWSQNIPNDHNIDQSAINIPTFTIARPSIIYQKRDFWLEKMTSGNPSHRGA
jgi:hypothetical protein